MSKVLTIDDVCAQIVDCEHKTAPIDPNGEYFAVGTPAMRGNSINFAESRRISKETFTKWTRRMLPLPGDILFAREAPVGPVVLIPESGNVAPGQRTMLLRPDTEQIDSLFLYYLLTSPLQQDRLLSLATGSTVAHLNVADVRAFSLPKLPTVNHQQAIAEVLGALDDKIAANTKTLGLLDDIILARYKALGSPEASNAIPLSSMLKDVIGGDWGSSESSDIFSETVHCIRGADIESLQSGGLGKMPTRFVKATSLNRRRLDDGDIVVEMSGGSPTQSTGRPALVTTGLLDRLEHSLMSSNFCRIVRLNDPRAAYYVYLTLRKSWESGEFFQFENGSTGIKNLAFADYCSNKSIILPSSSELAKFNDLASSNLELMQAIGAESERLTATRDTLLPQLMSGKLRVKDAEALISV